METVFNTRENKVALKVVQRQLLLPGVEQEGSLLVYQGYWVADGPRAVADPFFGGSFAGPLGGRWGVGWRKRQSRPNRQ